MEERRIGMGIEGRFDQGYITTPFTLESGRRGFSCYYSLIIVACLTLSKRVSQR